MQQILDLWDPYVEHCGFVLRDGSVVEVLNMHESPQDGFRISPEDILKHEATIIATWHTHPHTSGNLSVEDYRCFLNWPEWFHYICDRSKLHCYYVQTQRVFLHDDADLPRIPEGVLPQRKT